MAETVLAASVTYLVMVVAFFLARCRFFHVPVMVGVILFDLAMPFYLYFSRDWYRRLIVEGELMSFLLWSHFLMVLILYTIYILQIKTAWSLFYGDDTIRADHSGQGKALLVVRAFVILTGALLVEAPSRST